MAKSSALCLSWVSVETGKELAVTRLHYLSQRWQGPLVALHCAALSGKRFGIGAFGHEARGFHRCNAAKGGAL